MPEEIIPINSKSEYRNPKQIQILKNEKTYDLEERTFQFAKQSRNFIKTLTRTIGNIEDCKQLVRSSGSIGANYIEANEALSKKDFLMRIKICRKEAKESKLWLNLIDVCNNVEHEVEKGRLIQEAAELTNIFGAIFRKSE